jgi:hypothetical protein
MAFTSTVRLDALRTVANGSITSSYTTFGSSFAHRMRMIKITNNTDGDMFIAFNSTPGIAPLSNGTADNDLVPAGSFILYDFTSNSESSASPFVFEVGTQVWIRYSSAPTQKSVYLAAVYGKGE